MTVLAIARNNTPLIRLETLSRETGCEARA
jgi:hypothetical protein